MTDNENEMTQAERIRWLMHRCDTREDEIADLEERLNATTDQVRVQHIEIATLKAERDLLRREVCLHRAAAIQDRKPEDIAAALQWDCFRESPLDRLATMDEENGL